LTALFAVMVDPNASYEIVGVLREVFGISDDELARFAKGDGHKFQIDRRTTGRGVVADTLNLLTKIREMLPHQPLFSAVREIVRMTQLRERLRSLPREEFGDSVSELDKLLSTVASAEAQQNSLADVVLTLRRNFDRIRETQPAESDAIQLITAHKAKGSEWDAVIVPFLAREARLGAAGAYPRIIPGERPQIAFDYSDVADVKDDLERIQRQEMERLLYVALTRARHTLVFALDADFFRGAKGQVHSDTQLKWLQADTNESNAEIIAGVPDEASACAETAARRRELKPEPVSESLSALQFETGWIDIARQKAASIIKTVSPSQFAPEEEAAETPSTEEWIEIEPELRPPRIDNPATRYGVWWHDFAEKIPWVRALHGESATGLAFNSNNESKLVDVWDRIFQVSVTSSPDPARSKREWQLLQEQIKSSTEFGQRLRGCDLVRHEMPFFWKIDSQIGGTKSLEGIVDLAFFDPAEKKWFIMDWKTNRITANEIEKLRVHYRPQIAAYWKAVSEMTGAPVEAAIYSTANGQLILYDQTELANEWERLRSLPPYDLAGEIAGSGERTPLACW
jgi:ATP-dependent exoDNAse (exonuclease V) beta subunit